MKKYLITPRGFSFSGLLLVAIFSFQLLTFNCVAQNPMAKKWDTRFGGGISDYLFSFQQTKDGGYILGGYSSSDISGDKTQGSQGGWDYWIVKTDSNGVKQWDATFGGMDDDQLFSLKQTTDGGYILGGYSYSGISGDKSRDNWDVTEETTDYWLVKTDSNGVKQWDATFGGDNWDVLFSMQQTTDGGYILGGYSLSGISGDKTQDIQGGYDYWIVKTDSNGVKQWDARYGGDNDDMLFSLQQTTDGGYILGGASLSGISGDLTQANWDASNTTDDYWLVKTDANGVKQWDARFGGTNYDEMNCLQQTADGGFILGGNSYSDISGNKTQNTQGVSDYWLVKTDSNGVLLWDKDFGGADYEDNSFGNITQTTDGGYLVAGSSWSSLSGDKTESNMGPKQTWLVKTDAQGSKQWDKTIFTIGHDDRGFAVQTKDGCYAIANYTSADIGGYKTQASQGLHDYWLVKLCDSTLANGITPLSILNSQFSIYPNPFSDELSIKYEVRSTNAGEIILYDVTGKEILRQKITEGENKINTEKIAAGFYLLNAGGRNFKVVKSTEN